MNSAIFADWKSFNDFYLLYHADIRRILLDCVNARSPMQTVQKPTYQLIIRLYICFTLTIYVYVTYRFLHYVFFLPHMPRIFFLCGCFHRHNKNKANSWTLTIKKSKNTVNQAFNKQITAFLHRISYPNHNIAHLDTKIQELLLIARNKLKVGPQSGFLCLK